MSDTYPSTDEEQYVHFDLDYPDAEQDLNRWLPLVKWLLAFPHIVVSCGESPSAPNRPMPPIGA